MEFASDNETAVCNLASIVLPSFLDSSGEFDFNSLHDTTKVLVRNLNKVVDVTTYPTATAAFSNLRHRPIGIGVQGLSDLFLDMKLPFDSDRAKELNRDIAETLYHAALEASCEIARTTGPYHSFQDSPTSHGQLQFDMWGIDPGEQSFDWSALRARIKHYGLANSLLIAYMPTAGTTQITGCSEACEPAMRYVSRLILFFCFHSSKLLMHIISNLFSRRVLSGEFNVISTRLVDCLEELQLWSTCMRDKILENRGMSVIKYYNTKLNIPRFCADYKMYPRRYQETFPNNLGNCA